MQEVCVSDSQEIFSIFRDVRRTHTPPQEPTRPASADTSIRTRDGLAEADYDR